jgi:hypothetical protein
MAEDDPEGYLVIRAGGRTIHPSPDDTEQIWEAVVAVTEVFESLIEVAADERSAAGLRAGGNGEVQGPTPGDLQEMAQELSEALTAFSGNELNVDALRRIAADLHQRAAAARDLQNSRRALWRKPSRSMSRACCLQAYPMLQACSNSSSGCWRKSPSNREKAVVVPDYQHLMLPVLKSGNR